MALNVKALARDESKAADGVWFTYPEDPETTFKIRSLDCQQFRNTMTSVGRKFPRQRDGTRAITREGWCEILARSLLVDWKGVQDGSGRDLECTFENRLWVLSNVPEIFRFVEDSAGQEAEFRRDMVESEGKRSADTSHGSLNTGKTKPTGKD